LADQSPAVIWESSSPLPSARREWFVSEGIPEQRADWAEHRTCERPSDRIGNLSMQPRPAPSITDYEDDRTDGNLSDE
jgi:hypothetical protein